MCKLLTYGIDKKEFYIFGESKNVDLYIKENLENNRLIKVWGISKYQLKSKLNEYITSLRNRYVSELLLDEDFKNCIFEFIAV